MKRLLLVSLLVAFALPATANAALCRNKIYNDWLADGRIASTYSHACYVDALHHSPSDANVYSSLREDITAAMRANARRADGKAAPGQVGHGFTTHSVLASSNTSQPPASETSTSASSSHDPAVGEKSAAGAALTSSKSGAPVPVLVLGGLALALLAAGAVGAGVKHSRSRRS
jgi:cobalamin biosynthesis Mg chelatase CobN